MKLTKKQVHELKYRKLDLSYGILNETITDEERKEMEEITKKLDNQDTPKIKQ